ncbi:DUF2190 family protein [Cystobacter fuscus]|uniref:DUF2190 family protein n=1 Tax=Cystobacter fuscus TaxID=43 RepID=UPI002B316DD9|nr:DUF2190 family protein [Cystobacter fuscus]
MKTFIQPGSTLTLTAPAGGVVSDGVYLIGALVVVAEVSAAAGQQFAAGHSGVYGPHPKTAGEAWTEGALLYWNNTTKALTTTATNNTRAGYAYRAASSGDTTGTVFLRGGA